MDEETYYPKFFRTYETFEERTGDPDSFSCAIGRIAIWFSSLDDEVTDGIHRLLEVNSESGQIITAEMSFKNKVHAMASLVRQKIPDRQFTYEHDDAETVITTIVARCFQAEELRNQVMHSSWIGSFLASGRAVRSKTTAKAKRGLHTHSEEMDSGYLLDIADFISELALFVEDFLWKFDNAIPT